MLEIRKNEVPLLYFTNIACDIISGYWTIRMKHILLYCYAKTPLICCLVIMNYSFVWKNKKTQHAVYILLAATYLSTGQSTSGALAQSLFADCSLQLISEKVFQLHLFSICTHQKCSRDTTKKHHYLPLFLNREVSLPCDTSSSDKGWKKSTPIEK